MSEQDPVIQQITAEPTIIQINSAPTEPIESIPEQHPQLDRRSKIFAGLLAAELVIGGFSVAYVAEGRQASAQNGANISTCPAPSEAAITAVTKLVDTPQWFPKYPYGTTKGQAHKIYRTEKAAIEKSLGVTTADMSNLTIDVFPDDAGHYPQPYNAYLSAVQKFAQKYGVNVELLSTAQASQVLLGKPPQAKQLETDTAKEVTLSIAEGLSAFPINYLKRKAIKIYLATDMVSDDKSDSATAYAETGGADNTIVESVDNVVNPDVTDHEIGHLISTELCGSPLADANDPTYIAHNGGNIYYDTPPSLGEPQTQRDFKTFLMNVEPSFETNESNFADSVGRTDAYTCRHNLMRTLNVGKKVVVDSDYAYTNVVEDKAQILRDIFNPEGFLDSINPEAPIVRYKTIIELARLYQQDPNLVKYYTMFSWRSPSDADMCPVS